MIKRYAEEYLTQWYSKTNRKPLVIRGARQVGKSTLIKEFAKNSGHSLLEINLEKNIPLDVVFKRLNVSEILREISIITGKTLDEKSGDILFLDEIQAVPSAIPALRYLYEERPELHVVAAGSLLEFALKEYHYSMPVGRIEYLYLSQVSFSEYVIAKKKSHLIDYIRTYDFSGDFSEEAHQQLCSLLREYVLLGGMPEAVAVFLETEDISRALQVHHSILDTYINDFNKYAFGTALQRLQRLFAYVPTAVGEKFKYSKLNPEWQARDIRSALDLLERAGVLFKVLCTSGAGIPLEADADDKVFKLYFLDVGLMHTASGIKTISNDEFFSTKFINEGKLAEQFVAQHLRTERELYIHPQLHYWLREKRSNNAEVDFLIQIGQVPVPVEVKAGKSGSLKSLHLFCDIYNTSIALRLDLNKPSKFKCEHEIISKDKKAKVNYTLINLPLYMVEEVRRLAGG
jgi:predicted AAA+ superfamily ATPase